jgi:hypothetical protein
MRILEERESKVIENKECYDTRETAEWVIYTYLSHTEKCNYSTRRII